MIRATVWDRTGLRSPGERPRVKGQATFTRAEGWHDTSGEWRLLSEIEPSPAILGETEWLRRMDGRAGMAYAITASKQD